MAKAKKLTLYNLPVFIEPCEEGGYFGSCPSLPGCFVEAKTISQAVEYLEDAIAKFIESYQAHGDPLPEGVKFFQAKPKRKEPLPVSFFLPIRVAS